MSDGTSVPIAEAKGRPMLQWVGKRPLLELRSGSVQRHRGRCAAQPFARHHSGSVGDSSLVRLEEVASARPSTSRVSMLAKPRRRL